MKKLIIIILLFSSLAIYASPKDIYQFKNPNQKILFNNLNHELRCLVCQNQNLADSHAELAMDLKNEVYQMVLAGKSGPEIKHYLVQRYGDFVLYKPPVQNNTILLWAGPFIILFIGLIIAGLIFRKNKKG